MEKPGARACLAAVALALAVWSVPLSGCPFAPAGEAAATAVEAKVEKEAAVGKEAGAADPSGDESESESAPAPAPPVADASVDEAERVAREHKEKREQERQAQMAQAEVFVETADKTVRETLPYPLNRLLDVSLFGITLWRYIAAAAVVLLTALLLFAVSRRMRRAERIAGDPGSVRPWQLAIAVTVAALRHSLLVIGIGLLLRWASTLLLTVYHPDVMWVSGTLLYFGIVVFLFRMTRILDGIYGTRLSQGDNRLMETVRPILVKLAQALILLVAGLHIYQDLTGQRAVSVLAGLGIGGLALALASQETLRNLLGFASIAFDRVLFVGDMVNIAGFEGTVEHVGLRSLRLRTYDGRSVIIPNNVAIGSSIVNLARRPFIRREVRIALNAKNPYEKIDQAMELIREVLSGHNGKIAGLPPVVRFVDFEPGRFVIQALFWYDPEKPFYHDECSRVNLEIAARLSGAGVRYAEWDGVR